MSNKSKVFNRKLPFAWMFLGLFIFAGCFDRPIHRSEAKRTELIYVGKELIEVLYDNPGIGSGEAVSNLGKPQKV